MRPHDILRSKYQVADTKRNMSLLNCLLNTWFIKPKTLYFIGKKYIKNTCIIKKKYENTTFDHANPEKTILQKWERRLPRANQVVLAIMVLPQGF